MELILMALIYAALMALAIACAVLFTWPDYPLDIEDMITGSPFGAPQQPEDTGAAGVDVHVSTLKTSTTP